VKQSKGRSEQHTFLRIHFLVRSLINMQLSVVIFVIVENVKCLQTLEICYGDVNHQLL
jgi:hypothetical protein